MRTCFYYVISLYYCIIHIIFLLFWSQNKYLQYYYDDTKREKYFDITEYALNFILLK